MTKRFFLYFLFLFEFLFYNPLSLAQNSPGNWKDEGFLNQGDLFVSCEKNRFDKEPWVKLSQLFDVTDLSSVKLNKGWQRISAQKTTLLKSSKNVKFVVTMIADTRGFRGSPVKATVEDGKIIFLIQMQTYGGVYEKNYMPQLSKFEFGFENLKSGVYSLFLDATLIGNLKVI